MDAVHLKQGTTHGQPFDSGQSELWKGAEHWGSPEVGAHPPCKAEEGSCLAPSWLSLPTGLGGTLGCAEPTHQTRASSIWRQHTHTPSCLLFVFEMPGLLIIYLNEVSSGHWVTKKHE